MSLTLDEIARQAGVSRATVSRVLNNRPYVSAQARERVLAIAQKLNFHPNLAARGLAAGQTRILGLVIPMGISTLFTDPYFPLLIQGVAVACNARSHSVMLWLAEPEYERMTINQILHNGLIDGVILASMRSYDPLLETLASSDMPFVLVGRPPTDLNVTFVDVDNRNSARECVNYLLRLGHARVATVTGPLDMVAGLDRFEGYKMALRDGGLTVDPALIATGDFTEESGYGGTQQLLGAKPTAIFVAGDTMALGTLRAIRDAGLRVPDDVAVVGFDDMPFAARTDPPLTTMRQVVRQQGMRAAESLIDLIMHPDSPPRAILLPTELIVRSSCGGRKRAEQR